MKKILVCLFIWWPLCVATIGSDEIDSSQCCCICHELVALAADKVVSNPAADEEVVRRSTTVTKFLRRWVLGEMKTEFACAHESHMHESCLKEWTDREHYNCPVCRAPFKWNINRWISFMESEENRDGVEYVTRTSIGVIGFFASTLSIDQLGLQCHSLEIFLIACLVIYTVVCLWMSLRESTATVSWDALQYMR